jgi:hypothetical protein
MLKLLSFSLVFIFLNPAELFGQYSWTTQISFKLYNQKGKPISYQDFQKGRLKVYDNFWQKDARFVALKYDSAQNIFVYTKYKVQPGVRLKFVYKGKKMIIDFNYQEKDSFFIDGIILSKGKYQINKSDLTYKTKSYPHYKTTHQFLFQKKTWEIYKKPDLPKEYKYNHQIELDKKFIQIQIDNFE